MLNKKYLLLAALILIPLNNARAEVHNSLLAAKNVIQSTAAASFKNNELRTAYLYDLEGVDLTLTIAEGETDTASKSQIYTDARLTVNKLIDKTTGCSSTGEPGIEDWLVNCSDAGAITSSLQQLANEIFLLIQ